MSPKVLIAAMMLTMLFQCGLAFAQTPEEGLANFYSDKFQGKKMSNGELYDYISVACEPRAARVGA